MIETAVVFNTISGKSLNVDLFPTKMLLLCWNTLDKETNTSKLVFSARLSKVIVDGINDLSEYNWLNDSSPIFTSNLIKLLLEFTVKSWIWLAIVFTTIWVVVDPNVTFPVIAGGTFWI